MNLADTDIVCSCHGVVPIMNNEVFDKEYYCHITLEKLYEISESKPKYIKRIDYIEKEMN